MEHKVRLSEPNGTACANARGKFSVQPSDSHKGIR